MNTETNAYTDVHVVHYNYNGTVCMTTTYVHCHVHIRTCTMGYTDIH